MWTENVRFHWVKIGHTTPVRWNSMVFRPRSTTELMKYCFPGFKKKKPEIEYIRIKNKSATTDFLAI